MRRNLTFHLFLCYQTEGCPVRLGSLVLWLYKQNRNRETAVLSPGHTEQAAFCSMLADICWKEKKIVEQFWFLLGLSFYNYQQLVTWHAFKEHTDLVIGNVWCYQKWKKKTFTNKPICNVFMFTFFKKCIHSFEPLFVSGKNLTVVQNTKILGLTISSNLTWNNHIGEIIKKQTNACTL